MGLAGGHAAEKRLTPGCTMERLGFTGENAMKKTELRELFFPADIQYRRTIEEKISQNAWETYRWAGWGICAFQILMVVVFIFKKGGPFTSARRSGYFFSYLALLTLTLLFLYCAGKWHRQGARLMRLGEIYCGAICLWACVITALDQFGGNGLQVFCYMLPGVAALSVLRPRVGVGIFGTAFVLLNLVLPLLPGGRENLFNNLVNSFSITFFSIYLSASGYRSKVAACYSKIVIQRQYEEIMEMNRQLSQMVMTDPLTGLHNRRWLEEALRPQLEKDMVSSDGITGMMLDIDYFKEYNDCYGHIAGDRCLAELAVVLSAAAERSELQLVRYGGEEFFLCGECGGKAPLSAAEEVREAVEKHGFLRKDRPEGRLTVSIGVYCSEPGRKVRLEELVSRADAALYQAKKCGRNRAELFKEDKARF